MLKFNEKGEQTYQKWEDIYYAELAKMRQEMNDPEYIEGWCIIDDWDHIHNIEDEIGLLLFGYEDLAMGHIMEWCDDPDDEYMFGYSYRKIVEMMKEYFDFDEAGAREFEWEEG